MIFIKSVKIGKYGWSGGCDSQLDGCYETEYCWFGCVALNAASRKRPYRNGTASSVAALVSVRELLEIDGIEMVPTKWVHFVTFNFG